MSQPTGRVARHFPEGIDLDGPAGRALAMATLLEHGDRADLAWLAARVEREELARWFARHGARRLTRRSRALWAAVFEPADTAPPPAAPTAPTTAQSLWPLA